MNTSEKICQISLLEIEGIGPSIARHLIEHFGSAKSALSQDKTTYLELKQIGKNIITAKEKGAIFRIAENEIEYCERNQIEVLSYNENQFPQRLIHCADAPLILYYQGCANLNKQKTISVVGTRNATQYGKNVCEDFIESLTPYDPAIVSGLAYGIDICAHKKALKVKSDTVAVLAHGLDRVYPKAHANIARQIIDQGGGLLTEFKMNTNPDRENFPKRNRIVAGMSDATIVIESAIKGGSIITANLANSYNRDVFAVPGKIDDKQSEGCNLLIKTNRAHLMQSYKDVAYILGWDISTPNASVIQKDLFANCTEEERFIVNQIQSKSCVGIDEIANALKLPMSSVSTQLLMMEFKGIIKQVPGKKYELQ